MIGMHSASYELSVAETVPSTVQVSPDEPTHSVPVLLKFAVVTGGVTSVRLQAHAVRGAGRANTQAMMITSVKRATTAPRRYNALEQVRDWLW